MEQIDQKFIDELIAAGEKRLAGSPVNFNFETGYPEAEHLLNDIKNHSHIFVLACVMDKQVKAGRAWAIPYIVGRELGGFDFAIFRNADQAKLLEIFNRLKLHRFNNDMAISFFSAVHDIDTKYHGDASRIWLDPACPKSALVIRRLLEFRGVGIKIATMMTNILVRDFKVPMSDLSSIDISPDVQVQKFFVAKGLIREGASIPELIYLARELCPKYPGLLDLVAWEGGRALPRKMRKVKGTE